VGEGVEASKRQSDIAIQMGRNADGSVMVFPGPTVSRCLELTACRQDGETAPKIE
jgi:hypothetical protein